MLGIEGDMKLFAPTVVLTILQQIICSELVPSVNALSPLHLLKEPGGMGDETVILVNQGSSQEPVLVDYLTNPTVMTAIDRNNTLPIGKTIFNRDMTDEELSHPLAFGTLHYVPHRSFVVVHVYNSDMAQAAVRKLATTKVVKANRDVFIFYGEIHIVSDFSTSSVFLKLVYVHVMYQSGSHVSSILNLCNPIKPSSDRLRFEYKDCRSSIRGKAIHGGVVSGEQWYQYENNPDGSLKKARGIYHYVFQELSFRLNFTMKVHATTGSGSKVNGTWKGGIGDLLTGKADVAFPAGMVLGRNYAVDFTNMLSWFDRVFWVKPSPKKPKADAIFKPLNVSVWTMTIVAILLSMPILFYFIRKDHIEVGHDHKEKTPKFSKMVHHVVDITTRILLEQSTSLRECTGVRTRSAIFLLATFSIIISTGYRSKLFFFLTFNEGEPVPRTHLDLAYSNYKLIFRYYSGVAYKHLESSNDPMHKTMLTSNRLELVNSTVECIKRILLEEKAACMDYGFSGDYVILAHATLYYSGLGGEESQHLKRSVDVDGHFPIAWAVKKGSPLAKIFNALIPWFFSSGLHDHWVDLDWSEAKIRGRHNLKRLSDSAFVERLEELQRDANSRVTSLSVNTLKAPLMLVVIGAAISATVFLCEVAATITCHANGILIYGISFRSSDTKCNKQILNRSSAPSSCRSRDTQGPDTIIITVHQKCSSDVQNLQDIDVII